MAVRRIAGGEHAITEHQHFVIPHLLVRIAIDVGPIGDREPAAIAGAGVDDEDSLVLEDQQKMIDLLDDVAFLDVAHLVVCDAGIGRKVLVTAETEWLLGADILEPVTTILPSSPAW